MIEARLRTVTSDAEVKAKIGHILGPEDFNLVATGPARLLTPRGDVLAVYLPGVLSDVLGAQYETLHGLRGIITDNRGAASGAKFIKRGDQRRIRSRRVASALIGAVDPGPAVSRTGGRLPVCRLTAWTGRHLPEWEALTPLLQAIAGHLADQVPDRSAAQWHAARNTHPDWVVPGTPFTTVTVNNTYATGVHKDAGDLPEGFSTLAVLRRGQLTGGHLVLPRYRIGFDMGDGDLLLFDAHEWHGNAMLGCAHRDGHALGPCPQGCERISLVTYFRTKLQACGSGSAEAAKATAHMEAATVG